MYVQFQWPWADEWKRLEAGSDCRTVTQIGVGIQEDRTRVFPHL